MVAHSTTKTFKTLEIENLFQILSQTDKVLNCFYIFGEPKIVPYRPSMSLKICPIVSNLKVPNRYHSHTKHFLLLSDISTD